MGATITKGAIALAAGALLTLGPPTLAAPRDMSRFSPPGAPAYKRPWIGEACKQEFSTLCSNLPSNSRRDAIVDCLKQHSSALSPSCNEAISDRPEGMKSGGRGRRGHGERHVEQETTDP